MRQKQRHSEKTDQRGGVLTHRRVEDQVEAHIPAEGTAADHHIAVGRSRRMPVEVAGGSSRLGLGRGEDLDNRGRYMSQP